MIDSMSGQFVFKSCGLDDLSATPTVM